MEKDVFDEFINELVERLSTLGYDYVEATDKLALKFLTDKVENHINNVTNQEAIPIELHQVFIDMVCGNFLKEKASTNMLTAEQIEAVVSNIDEGDTSISFDVKSSPQALFSAFIDKLITNGEKDFYCFRKFIW